MKPEQRLAAALDDVTAGAPTVDDLYRQAETPIPLDRLVEAGIVPGVDDLVDEMPDVRQEVKDALMDVMLGPVVDKSGKRAETGINTYIRYDIPVPKVRLIGWQDTLRRALEKL